MTTARTKRSIIGALAIATLALTSCAAGGNTPTPTSSSATPTAAPTPQQSLPPVSKEESIKSAQAAYKEYLDVYAAIAADGGKNEEPLVPLGLGMTNGGRASEFFRGLVDTKSHTSGTMKFKYLEGDATTWTSLDGKTTRDFGQVDMKVCLDNRDFKVVGPDGKDTGKYGPEQILYSVTSIWYNGRWTITKDWITDDKVTPCDAS